MTSFVFKSSAESRLLLNGAVSRRLTEDCVSHRETREANQLCRKLVSFAHYGRAKIQSSVTGFARATFLAKGGLFILPQTALPVNQRKTGMSPFPAA